MIRTKNDGELLNILLEIHGYTKLEFAEIFDLSLDTVKSWVRDGINVPSYALRYLIDTLELELRLMGYMIEDKKASFILIEIQKIQDKIIERRLDNDDLPQNILNLDIDALMTTEKPMKTLLISKIANIQNRFFNKMK
jgi:transcriptional regulator with XRE-family HTH domain